LPTAVLVDRALRVLHPKKIKTKNLLKLKMKQFTNLRIKFIPFLGIKKIMFEFFAYFVQNIIIPSIKFYSFYFIHNNF
jgi:hypothetical protein